PAGRGVRRVLQRRRELERPRPGARAALHARARRRVPPPGRLFRAPRSLGTRRLLFRRQPRPALGGLRARERARGLRDRALDRLALGAQPPGRDLRRARFLLRQRAAGFRERALHPARRPAPGGRHFRDEVLTMRVAVDISLYPLAEEFLSPIKDVIRRFNEHESIEVETNTMSTQIRGEY